MGLKPSSNKLFECKTSCPLGIVIGSQFPVELLTGKLPGIYDISAILQQHPAVLILCGRATSGFGHDFNLACQRFAATTILTPCAHTRYAYIQASERDAAR